MKPSLGYIQEKKPDEAISQYEKILNKNPEYYQGHMVLGTIYDRKGDGEEAESHYRRALEIKKDFAPAANNLAWRLAESGGNIDEALNYASIAKEKMPKHPSVMDTLGWIYYLKGSYLNAISELWDSLELEPENPVINYHLGMAYYKNNQIESAKVYLDNALEINPYFKGADEARRTLNKIKSS